MKQHGAILRKLLIALGVVVVAVAIYGVSVYRRFAATPTYWTVVDTTQPNVARDAAEFEKWLSTQLTKYRPQTETWRIELSAEEVNKWLATRLAEWASNQSVDLPDWLGHPMVAIEPDRLLLAAELRQADAAHIVSVAYAPAASTDPVAMELRGIYIGELKVADSAGELFDLVRRFAGDGALDERQVAEWQGQLQTVRLEGRLGDGRTVKVTDVQLDAGKLVLTCQTLSIPTR